MAWPVGCRFLRRKAFISMSPCDLMHALDDTGLHPFAARDGTLGGERVCELFCCFPCLNFKSLPIKMIEKLQLS